MRHLKALALAGLAGLTAACGSDTNPVLPTVTNAVIGLVTPPAPPPDVRAQLTPAVLAQVDGPLLIVEIPAAPSAAPLGVAGTNGQYVTWSAENSTLVITKGGVLTGTRGLGFDLMNADVDDTLRALASGGGFATRVHRYVDGEGKVVVRNFACSISLTGHDTLQLLTASVSAAKLSETCTGRLGGVFTNEYWLAGGTEIVKSTQWASPQVGYLLTERAK